MDKIRRKLITQVVKEFFKKYPQELEKAKKHTALMRSAKLNIHGSDKQKEWRHEITIPTKLFNILDYMFDNPRFLESNKETSWFIKKFDIFKPHEKW